MKAVTEVEDGILVNIEVSPKSKKFKISGYNQWRERIEVRVKSPPTKGKANREISEEFTKLTGQKSEIISGLKSQHKTLKVYKLSKSDFLKCIGM